MCGRFTQTADADTIQETFELAQEPLELIPRYNIAPTQPVAVVVQEDDERHLDAFRWGLVPFWAKALSIGNRMINARGETVAEKRSFKRSFQSQRCLIIADGFFEWRKTDQGKIPTYIHLTDRQPFAMAGLWDTWTSPEDEVIPTCTIITTTPNELMAPIHNRMPVILPAEAYATWLNPTDPDLVELQSLLKPYPAEAMTYYPVAKIVNSPRNDVAACIQPI